MKLEVLDHKRHIMTIDEFFSQAECDEWIAMAEKAGFDEAPITTGAGFIKAPETRNNTRVMMDLPLRAVERCSGLAQDGSRCTSPKLHSWACES